MDNSLQQLTRTYIQIIGGGGFGIVKTGIGDPYDKYAVKFLYASNCPSAKKEYIINKNVYNAYEIFLKCNMLNGISVVKPYDFTMSNCKVGCNKDNYDCAVSMERLFSPMSDGYAVHIAFNGVVPPSQINKIIYAGIAPRGYFYDVAHIQNILNTYNDNNIKTIEDIIYRIGILEGICIFGARTIAKDVEYILTVKDGNLNVTMIDFGMFEDLNVNSNYKEIANKISEAQEFNLYYHPYSEAIPEAYKESCKISFINGITEAYNCFDNPIYKSLYDELITIYNIPM
jgi:hypothetical protein